MRYTILLLMAVLAASAGAASTAHADEATFAGGCFWCMEPPYDKLDGVSETVSGYTGGSLEDPGYERVSSGATDHLEAMRVTYDPARVDYETLLETFWVNVDPFDSGGQFCDRGAHYTTAIFWHTEKQRRMAEASKARVEAILGREVVTPIREAKRFWPAEDYHQNYYRENPVRYDFYRSGCGRDRRLDAIWRDHRPLDLDLTLDLAPN